MEFKDLEIGDYFLNEMPKPEKVTLAWINTTTNLHRKISEEKALRLTDKKEVAVYFHQSVRRIYFRVGVMLLGILRDLEVRLKQEGRQFGPSIKTLIDELKKIK